MKTNIADLLRNMPSIESVMAQHRPRIDAQAAVITACAGVNIAGINLRYSSGALAKGRAILGATRALGRLWSAVRESQRVGIDPKETEDLIRRSLLK